MNINETAKADHILKKRRKINRERREMRFDMEGVLGKRREVGRGGAAKMFT